jgi:hypothetical protein
VVRQLDWGAADGIMPDPQEIAGAAELSWEDAAAAIKALNSDFVDLVTPTGDVSG